MVGLRIIRGKNSPRYEKSKHRCFICCTLAGVILFQLSAIHPVFDVCLLFVTHHVDISIICSLRLERSAEPYQPNRLLPVILPSKISRRNSSCINTWPIHLCFRCDITSNIFLLSLTFFNTSSSHTCVQLVFSKACLFHSSPNPHFYMVLQE